MNANKICFIMCVNDKLRAEEAIYYINRLLIPEGYALDLLTVEDAPSMAGGYNEAMNASDAKYKIYMHQDVLITEPHFLYHILDIFTDPQVGMIGMVGAPKMPQNGIMWHTDRIGKLYSCNYYRTEAHDLGPVQGAFQSVEAVDGFMMITQYDLPWREDLFKHFDFYDVSQSYEFRKSGYQVVVPYMDTPWCLHDDGFLNMQNYYNERRIFIEEYLHTR